MAHAYPAFRTYRGACADTDWDQRRRLGGRCRPICVELALRRGLRWEAHARSARLLYGRARFPRVTHGPLGPGKGQGAIRISSIIF